jgi:hypothetical protein
MALLGDSMLGICPYRQLTPIVAEAVAEYSSQTTLEDVERS